MANEEQGKDIEYDMPYDEYLKQQSSGSTTRSDSKESSAESSDKGHSGGGSKNRAAKDDNYLSENEMNNRALSEDNAPRANPSVVTSEEQSESEDTASSGKTGLVGSIKNGISNIFTGGMNAIKSAFAVGASKAEALASTYNVSVKTAAVAMLLTGGISLSSIGALLFSMNGSTNVAAMSSYDDCRMTDGKYVINELYEMQSEEDKFNYARTIYRALASPEITGNFKDRSSALDLVQHDLYLADVVSSETYHDVKQENMVDLTGNTLPLSDEVIFGIISNGYAESGLTPESYECNYWVGPKLNDADTKDLVLSQTHHRQWDTFVERMFELYGDTLAGGVSLNQDGYKYIDHYGDEHYYPGVGVWAWTGQRAYALQSFCDYFENPYDENLDDHNDAMYTLDGQLAFLLEENSVLFKHEYPTSPAAVKAVLLDPKVDLPGLAAQVRDDMTEAELCEILIAAGSAYETHFWCEDHNTFHNVRDYFGCLSEYAYDQPAPNNLSHQKDLLPIARERWKSVVAGCLSVRYVTFAEWAVTETTHYDTYHYSYFPTTYPNWDPENPFLWYYCARMEVAVNENGKYNLDHDPYGTLEEFKNFSAEVVARDRFGRAIADKDTQVEGGNEMVFDGDNVILESKRYPNSNGAAARLKRQSDCLWDLEDTYTDGACGGYVSQIRAKTFSVVWEGCPTAWLEAHFDQADDYFQSWMGHKVEPMRFPEKWPIDDNWAKQICELYDYNDFSNYRLRYMYADLGTNNCGDVFDNSDIATTAVEMAWPEGYKDLATENSDLIGEDDAYLRKLCTELYCAVRDIVIPDDILTSYSSCDRGVSTVVRACGADDFMPYAFAKNLLYYCKAAAGVSQSEYNSMPDAAKIAKLPLDTEGNGRWECISQNVTTADLDRLQPGDLLLSEEHVVIFVGPDAVKAKWPSLCLDFDTEAKYAVVHSSRGTPDDVRTDDVSSRGLMCQLDGSFVAGGGYWAFRCTNINSDSGRGRWAVNAVKNYLSSLERGIIRNSIYYAQKESYE